MKMKLVAAAMTLAVTTTSIAATHNPSLSSDKDKLSYSIGIDLGKNFKRQDIDVNPEVMVKGLQDGISGNKSLLTDEQMQDVLNKFQKELMAKKTADYKKQAEENKKKGEAFLKENKSKEGVVALPSGLQYKIVKSGSGAKPTKEDTVTVEYTGRLINGEVFDSTEKTGKPATFKLSQVIPGWTEALQLMSEGAVWEIYVPSDLAYGPRSVGGPIGPNETLIFKINLVDVKKSDAS